MPDLIAFRVRNSEEVRQWLKGLSNDLARKKMQTALKRTGRVLVQAIQAEAPERTGKLRGSVDFRIRGGRQAEQMRGQVRIGAWYWRLVHEGHRIRLPGKGKKGKLLGRKTRADPFVDRALARRKDEAVRAGSKYLIGAMKRYRRLRARG